MEVHSYIGRTPSDERTTKKRNSRKKGVSIRWKLFGFFMLFILLALVAVWVLQIYLLDTFHEFIKRKELENASLHLATVLGDEELQALSSTYTERQSVNVFVYRMDGETLRPVFTPEMSGEAAFPAPNMKILSSYYTLAKENGGYYEGQHEWLTNHEILPSDFPISILDRENYKNSKIPAENIRLFHVRLAADGAGNEYMILLTSYLLPLNSTSETLRYQFVWIVIFFLLLAAITAFVLYKRISKPLIAMNTAAKQLALGNYDVEFSGSGYRETRELADTLNYASGELSKVDHLQKELIANISHDLRTPLTMIKGYAEVMRDIPGEISPENMQIIVDETERLTVLVNDLMDLSKIQAGVDQYCMEEMSMTALLCETVERYDTLTQHQGYRILLSADENVSVMGDRTMLRQALYNLINNAIHYTGDDLSVRVTQTVRDGFCRVSIADSGEGIAQDQLPLIWDRYYKIDRVHQRAKVGTGLGLSIVKGVFEAHHAAYGVNSSIGHGSTFWFELPIVTRSETEMQNNTTTEE